MNELILQDFPDYPGLVDIGSCSIHVIHNAFGKGLEHYGKDVDQLCLDLYSLNIVQLEENTSKKFK